MEACKNCKGAQRRIKNPFKHLQLFLQSKFHCRCLTGFWICLSYSLSSRRPMKDTEQWKKSSEGVFKNFAKFTGKQPCQCLFFNKVTVAELRSAKMIIKDHKRWSDISFIKEYPKYPILYLYLQKFLKLILQIQLL